MKRVYYLTNFLLTLLIVYLFLPANILLADLAQAKVPEQEGKILRLTDNGIEPPETRMQASDGVIFFLNATKDSLVNLEVIYDGKTTHCSSANMKIEPNGVIQSLRPYGPKDFATVCFHDKGRYKINVFGLKKQPNGLTAEVIVE